jgi:hypothetical protein
MNGSDDVRKTVGMEKRGLGEEEVIRLVDETAKILLDEQDLKTETGIWVRRGIVIRSYVRKLQPDGKHHKPDPYVLLAEHPDIRWSADQLRNFVDAVELWEQIGEGQPCLTVTFYAIVASCKGSLEEKKALLRKAVAENLTTRAVKREADAAQKSDDAGAGEHSLGVAGEGGGAETGNPKGDWKKVQSYAEKLNGELSGVNADDLPDLDVIRKLKEVAARINALVSKFDKSSRK